MGWGPGERNSYRRVWSRGRMSARVGIVSRLERDQNLYVCNAAYPRAVEAAGGVPMLLPYLGSHAKIRELLDALDGVVLSGGTDMDPALYGEEMHPAIESVVPERDAFEVSLIRAFLDLDRPILGICRGMQSLNVALGGSLYADLAACLPSARNHRDGTPLRETVHPVEIEPTSRLARLAGITHAEVNSWHHQAVKAVGSGLHACAYASDGVVEAIESRDHRFVIGVQWHPEHLWERQTTSRRLFEALVAACATRSGR